jgi:hypothetical protein
MLPVLSRALQSAEAEFEELARKGREHQAGSLQVHSSQGFSQLQQQAIKLRQQSNKQAATARC